MTLGTKKTIYIVIRNFISISSAAINLLVLTTFIYFPFIYVYKLEILLMVLGIVLLIKGADFLVDGYSHLANKFGVSKLVIGLTIVAFSTSLPELIMTITVARKYFFNTAFGNIVG